MSFSGRYGSKPTHFMEEPPKKYYRLFPGNEVRLKGAYVVRCTGCKKDESGRDQPRFGPNTIP